MARVIKNDKKMIMKKGNRLGAYFTLRQYQELTGKSPIYARVCVNKKYLEISIRRSLSSLDKNKGRGYAILRTDELRSLTVISKRFVLNG